jgi:hypothetical protein
MTCSQQPSIPATCISLYLAGLTQSARKARMSTTLTLLVRYSNKELLGQADMAPTAVATTDGAPRRDIVPRKECHRVRTFCIDVMYTMATEGCSCGTYIYPTRARQEPRQTRQHTSSTWCSDRSSRLLSGIGPSTWPYQLPCLYRPCSHPAVPSAPRQM